MRDNIDFLGAGDDARIARIDAIDIGVDFTYLSALRAAAIAMAVKSLPPRPRVVI